MEFDVDVACPHCDCVIWTNATFDDGEFDSGGGTSHLMHETCQECNKEFWFEARLRFELDVDNTFTKKPKAKK